MKRLKRTSRRYGHRIAFLLISATTFLVLVAIIPPFSVGNAEYQMVVESSGELSDLNLFVRSYDQFSTEDYREHNRSNTADYLMIANLTRFRGYNQTDLNLTVRWMRTNSILLVSFPLKPPEHLDPEFNSTLYFPTPKVTGDIQGVRQICTRLIVFLTSGLILYSQSKVATVSSGSMDWKSGVVQEKNLTTQSLRLAAIAFAMLVGGVATGIFSKRVRRRLDLLLPETLQAEEDYLRAYSLLVLSSITHWFCRPTRFCFTNPSAKSL